MNRSGSEIHEYGAELLVQVRGRVRNADAITKFLKVEPSSPRKARTPRYSAWRLTSGLKAASSLDNHLRAVVNRLTNSDINLQKLHELAPTSKILLRCAHYTNLDNGFCNGPVLDTEIVSAIAKTGLSLTLETYSGTDYGSAVLSQPTSHGLVGLDSDAFRADRSRKKFIAMFLAMKGSPAESLASVPVQRHEGVFLTKKVAWGVGPSRGSLNAQLRSLIRCREKLRLRSSGNVRTRKSCLFWITCLSQSESGFCGITELDSGILRELGQLKTAICLENYNLTVPS